MESPYAYLLLSSALLVAWLVLFAVRPDIRREMVRVSVGTMFLGLTEPIFVPEYWNPPTLGDLARRTGFDLESLLFSFAIGGIVFAAYHVLFGEAPAESMAHERGHSRHRYHVLAILFAPVGFVSLLALTPLNPIYAAALALVGGFFATLYCRPDLWLKMLASGVLFLLLYLVVFVLFDQAFPGYVAAVWNLKAVSGVLLWGVPLEELLFAFTFGLYWSSMYEHLAWRRIRRPSGIAYGLGETRPAKVGERTP
jgi:hypothetical protein